MIGAFALTQSTARMRSPNLLLMLSTVVSAVDFINPLTDIEATRALPFEVSKQNTTCAFALSPCGTNTCFNPQTHQCCPGGTNICPASHNCVQVPTSNGTIAHGCCPSGTACGTECIDPSVSKCCAVPGGGLGSCPVSSDCCGDMCCDAGKVCARSSEGHQCWPVAVSQDAEVVEGASPTIEHTKVMHTVPAVKMATVIPGPADPNKCTNGKRATSIPGPGDPSRCGNDRNAGARPQVSIWLCVLLLCTPFVTAVSGGDLLNSNIGVEEADGVRRRILMPAITSGNDAPTTTMNAVSPATVSVALGEDSSTLDNGGRKEVTFPGIGPHPSGGARLQVSIWLYTLLLLAPFTAAISTFGRERQDDEVLNSRSMNEREVPVMVPTEGSPQTTTLPTAVSTATMHTAEAEQGNGADKKGGGGHGGGHGGGGHGSAARPGAEVPGGAHGAASRAMGLSTIWPLVILALPAMLAPLALANIGVAEVVNIDGGRPEYVGNTQDPAVTTSITAGSTPLIEHEEIHKELEEWETYKKGTGGRVAQSPGPYAHGAGSRAIDVGAIWPFALLTLPPLLNPLVLANLVVGGLVNTEGEPMKPDPAGEQTPKLGYGEPVSDDGRPKIVSAATVVLFCLIMLVVMAAVAAVFGLL
ncbi:hypothetical protein NX059_000859 [Plenodomus lindquistii]|nr:hypothetical protein NX059_000859 [Plenodomus lindquistii]